MSDTDRVLAALRRRGPTGVTATDFSAPHVLDGGKPIQRVAARIDDLKKRGIIIGENGTRNRNKVYVLADPVDLAPRPLNTAEAADAGALFTVEAEGPRVRGPYEDAA